MKSSPRARSPRVRRAFAACAFLALAACGERAPGTAPPAPDTTGEESVASHTDIPPLEWATTFEEAAARAHGHDTVILGYFGTDPSRCPPCARMDRVLFGNRESGRLQAACVPWKVRMDAEVLPDAERIGALRLGVLPALLVLTPEGGVLHRQYHGLYPVYGRDGTVIQASPSDLTLDELIARLEILRTRHARDRESLRELSARDDLEGLLAYARLLASHERWDEAQGALARAAVRAPGPEVEAELVEVLAAKGEDEQAALVLTSLVAQHADHADAARWKLRRLELGRRALGEDEKSVAQRHKRLECLGRLTDRLAREGKPALERRSRLLRVEEAIALRAPDRLSAEELTWVHGSHAGGVDAETLHRLLRVELSLGHPARAVRHAERILREHPASLEAQRLKHGVLDQLRFQARAAR